MFCPACGRLQRQHADPRHTAGVDQTLETQTPRQIPLAGAGTPQQPSGVGPTHATETPVAGTGIPQQPFDAWPTHEPETPADSDEHTLLVPPAALAQAAMLDDDDDDDTRIVPRREQRSAFVLALSTGQTHTVRGLSLLGRSPMPWPQHPEIVALVVDDPNRSVSKNHLLLTVTDGALWVTDAHSGNGSVLHPPGEEPVALQPGRAYRVPVGSRIDIGDEWFTVQTPQTAAGHPIAQARTTGHAG